MQAIYKVTDKELNKRIEEELDNVRLYMMEKAAKIKELIPDVENIAIIKSPFDGKHTILGFILKKGADDSSFKLRNETPQGENILVPKRNTKEGKRLSKELNFIGEGVLLFDEKKFEEELGYFPEQRETFNNDFMTLNYLRFGHIKVDESMVFIFRGYTGYKPNDKAQEITISEYNAMFGR